MLPTLAPPPIPAAKPHLTAAPQIRWLNPGESPQPRMGRMAHHHGHTLLPYCLFKRGGYYPEACIRAPDQDHWTTHPCPHPPGGYRTLHAALEQALTHGRALTNGTAALLPTSRSTSPPLQGGEAGVSSGMPLAGCTAARCSGQRALQGGQDGDGVKLTHRPRDLSIRLTPHPANTWTWSIDEAPTDLADPSPATVIATSTAPLPTRALAQAAGEQALAIIVSM